MSDRVAADNPAVETVRATVVRAGRTDRPAVALPDDLDLPDGVVRLVLDGRICYARVERALRDGPSIRGAFDAPSLAREDGPPGGTSNRLAEWVDAAGLPFGRSVLLDVVEPGRLYGLREPGESAVYEASAPDPGLADLAAEIDRRDGGRDRER